jgi:sulfur carrier protein
MPNIADIINYTRTFVKWGFCYDIIICGIPKRIERMSAIKIEVNGKEVEIQENLTILDFIKEKNVTGTMFVIEKNLKIVQKDEYETETIENGDKIEIVGFFGGG